MTSLAQRCGEHDAARAAACDAVLGRLERGDIDRVRVAWCDLHGALRCKTLMAGPDLVRSTLADGLGMVGTLLLKDTSDRTAYPVFESGAAPAGYGGAGNLMMLPDPASFRELPWAPGTGWMRAQPWFTDATPVLQDSRRVLQGAVSRLANAGYGLRCGLEVEFHVYRITDAGRDPALSAWPGEPPTVSLVHPGYQLLSEAQADQADAVLTVVQQTAQGLGLPLRSLEIELGPSQFEAVFDPLDALAAADAMVAFRSGVGQALRRAGYHASFVCRPPFPDAMASGWHLHQSLVSLAEGAHAMVDPQHHLSAVGDHWLAGLLANARAATVFATPTTNGYGRFRPNAMAPQAVAWGRDNRGALLRVIGGPGDPATRIENRAGEPAANPYAYIASQVHAGLDGLTRQLQPPPPTEAPYADGSERLPTSLGDALDALEGNTSLVDAMGRAFVEVLVQTKRQEQARYDAADDKAAFDRREYFGRS